VKQSEFELIERLRSKESKHLRKDTFIGIGDDCAVLQLPSYKLQNTNNNQEPRNKIQIKPKYQNQNYQLITTDTLLEGTHFKIAKKNKKPLFFNLGVKVLIANISDISSMGGYPTHALVTIGIPKSVKDEDVKNLYAGINSIAKKHDIDIVGGDTIRSSKLLVSITLMGEVEKENLLTRSGAKVGDVILATGKFGFPAFTTYNLLLTTYYSLSPVARTIAKSHLATAMIDSSDGLARSVEEICKRSKLGAKIFSSEIPIAKGATLKQVLFGGEEYELIFTVPKSKVANMLKKVKATVVGEIVDKGLFLVDSSQKIKSLKLQDFKHF